MLVLAPSRDPNARSRSIAGLRCSFSFHRETAMLVLAPSRDVNAHSRSIAGFRFVLAPSQDFDARSRSIARPRCSFQLYRETSMLALLCDEMLAHLCDEMLAAIATRLAAIATPLAPIATPLAPIATRLEPFTTPLAPLKNCDTRNVTIMTDEKPLQNQRVLWILTAKTKGVQLQNKRDKKGPKCTMHRFAPIAQS